MYNGQQIFRQQFWGNGPAPGQFYNFTGGYNGMMNNEQCKEYTAPGLFGTQRSS